MSRRGKDLRVGNPEREQAISMLGEHLSAGRLDVHEYDQRCAQVAAASFGSQIARAFDDLPEPTFQAAPAAPERVPARTLLPKGAGVVAAVAAIVVLAIVTKQLWLLALVALAGALLLRRGGGER